MRRWIFFGLLLMTTPTFAKEAVVKDTPQRPLIKLVNDYDQILISIDPKGNVELGQDVSLDEASHLFWQHVTTAYPALKSMLCEQ